VPDWLGSGDLLHALHGAQGSGEPDGIQRTAAPGLELLRRASGMAPVPVWLGAISAVALRWRAPDRTVRALAFVVAAWTVPTVLATALGYPAVPRYLVEPLAACCVLAGIGLVALARVPRSRRGRAAVAVALGGVSIPFVVATGAGLAHQATEAQAWTAQQSGLWTAVNRAREHGEPIDRLHPLVEPGAMANGLAWKLGMRVHDVRGALTPAAHIAFLDGNDGAVLARLRRRDATATPLAAAGPWHVLLLRWAPRPAAER
jgi:hypothetical protein